MTDEKEGKQLQYHEYISTKGQFHTDSATSILQSLPKSK